MRKLAKRLLVILLTMSILICAIGCEFDSSDPTTARALMERLVLSYSRITTEQKDCIRKNAEERIKEILYLRAPTSDFQPEVVQYVGCIFQAL